MVCEYEGYCIVFSNQSLWEHDVCSQFYEHAEIFKIEINVFKQISVYYVRHSMQCIDNRNKC